MNNKLNHLLNEYVMFLCNNDYEKKELINYFKENIENKSFREEMVNNFNSFLSSPSFAFYDNYILKTVSNIVDTMNEYYKENHTLNINNKGIIFDRTITIEQLLKLAENLNITSLSNLNLYDINEKQSYIDTGNVGIYVKCDDEIFIADIPIDKNDPLQIKEVNEQLDKIIYLYSTPEIKSQARCIAEKIYEVVSENDVYEYRDYQELQEQEIELLTKSLITGNIKEINNYLDNVSDEFENQQNITIQDENEFEL